MLVKTKKENDEGKTKGSVPIVDSLATALRILDCFTVVEPELSLKQLSDRTGLYKSRIHRLCATLVAAGFLVRMPSSSYKLGPKLMTLGKVYESTNTLLSIARPVMRDLAALTGESVALFARDGDKCLCVAREFGSSRLVFAIHEGDYMHLHATAAGRILLSYGPEDLKTKFLSNPNLEKFTPSTIVDPQRLRDELDAIRERGYAVNKEERESGIAAIAAPLFDHENKVDAALAVVGPSQRFSDSRCIEIQNKLLTATRKISELLGASV